MLTATRRTIRAIVVTVIAVAFLAFAVDNREFVTISLFPFSYTADLPKFLLIILCFACGIIVGGTTVHLKLTKTKRMVKAEHKRVRALQNEVRTLQAEHQEKTSAVAAVPAKI